MKLNNSPTTAAQHRPLGWLVGLGRLAVLLAGLAATACSGKPENPAGDPAAATAPAAAADVYTCSMHPQILRDEPGDCPICGMNLVKKASMMTTVPVPAASASGTAAGGTVPASNEQVLTRVQLVQPSPTADSAATIVAPGTIAYDPRRFENVAARFGGRIERLYVRYQFQPVRAGQKLFDIYSPELVTEQQNLLFLLKTNDPDDRALLNASRQKLRLLGLTAAQVRAVEQRGLPQLSVSVFSPVSGYVMETGAAAAAGASGMSQPGSAPVVGTALEQTAPLAIQEGQYVERGQRVLQVANIDQVWVRLQLYARDVAAVQPGQPVEITLNDRPQAPALQALVALLEPVLAGDAATVTARVYLPNPGGQLKIGQLVTGRITPPAASGGLWVPATAVVDLGTRQVVFRQQPDSPRLLAVAVVTGARRGTQVQVVRGLRPADRIAENGQFLVDSESFINPVADAQQ
ncbi:efflux RND transporter periplasmic adaptor subunit [Hymenobacter psychrophilus]|uniref:efflux RND transporter periplasmic adaptor subunit n=1 Tax=Hymenobacter psychrophilus TaxID=651662 RepID=UPI001587A7C1|nr:efflux RND transporter periplasmic adaptor subunit [Hymenobacter psychrophilus]